MAEQKYAVWALVRDGEGELDAIQVTDRSSLAQAEKIRDKYRRNLCGSYAVHGATKDL